MELRHTGVMTRTKTALLGESMDALATVVSNNVGGSPRAGGARDGLALRGGYVAAIVRTRRVGRRGAPDDEEKP